MNKDTCNLKNKWIKMKYLNAQRRYNGYVWYVVMCMKDMKHLKFVRPVIMLKAIIKKKQSK